MKQHKNIYIFKTHTVKMHFVKEEVLIQENYV